MSGRNAGTNRRQCAECDSDVPTYEASGLGWQAGLWARSRARAGVVPWWLLGKGRALGFGRRRGRVLCLETPSVLTVCFLLRFFQESKPKSKSR